MKRTVAYNVYIVDGARMAKTKVLSTRLDRRQLERLAREGRRLGRSPSETGALLIEEGLRRDEFGFIDFRESPAGRQAYIQGSTLAIWEIVWIAGGYDNHLEKTAQHLNLSPLKVQAALNYAKAFPDEIKLALAEHDAGSFESLSRMFPQAQIFPPAKKP